MRPPFLLACALVALSSAPAGAQRSNRGTCIVRGAGRIEHVRVQPPGSASFELRLRGPEVEVTARGAGPVALRTLDGLIFEGTAPGNEVPVAISREVAVADGVLALRPGTAITTRRLSSGLVDAELAHGVYARGVTLPCDALRVGSTAPATEAPADAPSHGALRSRGASFRIHARPGGPAITVEATELRLAELDRRGGWVRVRRDFRAGSTLVGWVRSRAVQSVPEEGFVETGTGYGSGSGSGCGSGGSHAYYGPATLRAGADVRYARDGVTWARADADLALERVVVRWNDDWARILGVDGLGDYEDCPDELDHAWVPVTALRFPPGAGGVPSSLVEPR